MVHLTIRGIGGNDPLEKIARAAARHPEIRIEAGVIAGDATWTGRRKPGAKTHSPSFERLREMIHECRVLGLGAAVHLEDCYAEMTRSGEHRIIRERHQQAPPQPERATDDTTHIDQDSYRQPAQAGLIPPTGTRPDGETAGAASKNRSKHP